MIGLAVVVLFMWLLYGRLGFIADIALVIYGILTLALYKMIPVTLSLPGLAGFILSVGMAVDSNILIFERMKEEQRWASLCRLRWNLALAGLGQHQGRECMHPDHRLCAV